jgi:hypothetical protein
MKLSKLMTQANNKKQLLKILFGAAWIDGIIQPEERAYLRRKTEEQGLIDDPEIHALLSEIKTVQPSQCYQWLQDYLGDNPTAKDYQNLVETISGLLYSDSDIQTQEAQLLVKLQQLDPALEPHKSVVDKALQQIRKLYRSAIKQET